MRTGGWALAVTSLLVLLLGAESGFAQGPSVPPVVRAVSTPPPVSDNQRRFREGALLSSDAYRAVNAEWKGNGHQAPPGFQVMGKPELGSDGFQGVAYKHTRTGEITIVYVGTNERKDVSAWGGILSGGKDSVDPTAGERLANQKWNSQVDQAQAFTDRIRRENPGATVKIAGHSMGGVLAQVESARTGLPADTYNAPGAKATVDARLEQWGSAALGDDSQIRNHYRQGDLASKVGDRVGVSLGTDNPSKLPAPEDRPLVDRAYDVYEDYRPNGGLVHSIDEFAADAYAGIEEREDRDRYYSDDEIKNGIPRDRAGSPPAGSASAIRRQPREPEGAPAPPRALARTPAPIPPPPARGPEVSEAADVSGEGMMEFFRTLGFGLGELARQNAEIRRRQAEERSHAAPPAAPQMTRPPGGAGTYGNCAYANPGSCQRNDRPSAPAPIVTVPCPRPRVTTCTP